jgi:hypothetical protein
VRSKKKARTAWVVMLLRKPSIARALISIQRSEGSPSTHDVTGNSAASA